MSEYGTIALVVWLTLFFSSIGFFFVAIKMGFAPAGASKKVGALFAAYLLTKGFMPVRAALTIALTPLCAKIWRSIQQRLRLDTSTNAE